MPMKLKDYQRVLRLHAMIASPTANPNEVRTARNALLAKLAEFGLGEQDLDDVIAKARAEVDKAEGRHHRRHLTRWENRTDLIC
jgi:hypothetical protein